MYKLTSPMSQDREKVDSKQIHQQLIGQMLHLFPTRSKYFQVDVLLIKHKHSGPFSCYYQEGKRG